MAWGSKRGIDDIVERLHANHPDLRSLYLMRQRQFAEAEAIALCQALASNTVLEELNVSSHPVTASMAAAFAELLKTTTTLRRLNLGDSSSGDDALVALCPGIAASKSLTSLNLSSKGIAGVTACTALAAALANNDALTELDISNNHIEKNGLKVLAPSLTNLRWLSLEGCALNGGVETGKALSPLLSAGCLESLLLDRNPDLDFATIDAFASNLSTAKHLRQLCLSWCHGLGSSGIARLATALPTTLVQLDISGTGACNEGIQVLARAISAGGVPKLHRLSLADCGADDIDLAALVTSFAQYTNVESTRRIDLDISSNTAGTHTLIAAARGPLLQSLGLHNCNLGGVEPDVFRDLLVSPGLTRLVELDLSGNGLGSHHVLALLLALESEAAACPLLRHLIIAANPGALGDDVVEEVEILQAKRPGLNVVRGASDGGEGK